MKRFFNGLLVVAAATLGLAIGFALRARSGSITGMAQPSPQTVTLLEAVPTKLDPVSHQRLDLPAHDDSPLATKLQRDLSMSSGVTRWLYWLEAIEKAAPADFPRLARLAQNNATAMRLLGARWVELDPRHLFDTIVAASKSGAGFPSDALSTMLLQEWPKRDPDAVIAALNGAQDFGSRSDWRMQVASAVVEKDAERGLRLMSEWHIENYGPRMTAVAKWAAADPRHAAEFTLEHPAGFASRLAMETIGKEWARTDPAQALEFGMTRRGELGSTLANAALKEWAGRNLNQAADWLGAADAATRNRLSATFVEAWAKQDAGNALAWCESNLTGSSLAQAVGGVLKGAAAKDVVGAAALVSGMNPSSARAEAALAVAQKWLPEYSSDKPVAPETITWLASLDPDCVKRVLDQIHWRWSESDPKSMAAFLASYPDEQIPTHAYSTLARTMARRNPTEALDWAGQLPRDRGLSAGSEAFSEWRRSQPDSAMKWLNELPPGDARRDPFFQSAIQSLAHEPQAAEQLAALSATDRTTARNIIAAMPLSDQHRANLLDALKPR